MSGAVHVTSYNGREIGSASSKYESSALGNGFHIRTGAIINDHHRVTFTANWTNDLAINEFKYSDSEGDLDHGSSYLNQAEYLLSYDYLHPISNNVAIFGGATVGSVKNTYTENYGEDKDVFSDSGIAWGLQFGAQYTITENWSTDITYRHMFSSPVHSYKEEASEDGLKATYTETYEVDSHSSITISLDYRF
jgi:opacity protein-like surface antigen